MPDTKKPRKPYPTHDERISAVETKIENVTKLIASREALVASTAAKLNERNTALERAKAELTALQEKKMRIIENKAKAANKVSRPKLSPEERKAHRMEALEKARAVRKAEKEKQDLLIEKLAASGKTIDELLAMIDNQ